MNILCIQKSNSINYILVSFQLFLFTACSFTYSFQGGKLNYDVLKTITVHNFKNGSSLVYPRLPQIFEQILTNKFIERTLLKPTVDSGDIEIEGEITRYDVQNIAVKADAFASQIKLSIEIKVKYINHRESNSDVDQKFLAFRICDVNYFHSMQDILVREIVNELVDMIYNATVANW